MEEAEERYQEKVAFPTQAWTSRGPLRRHGSYWNFYDVVIGPAPVQNRASRCGSAPPSPNSISDAAEKGLRPALGARRRTGTIAEGVSIYRRAVEAQGRFRFLEIVGLTRHCASR